MKVSDITAAVEAFAPLSTQEGWDSSGLQVGDTQAPVSAVMVCLDVTVEIVREAVRRRCSMIVSHHPLLFRGLKHITPEGEIGRVAIEAIRAGISIYSCHTPLDKAPGGISHEIARRLGLRDVQVLAPDAAHPGTGLGVIGECQPAGAMEFLRRLKDTFQLKEVRYSTDFPKLAIQRVAICGGAGAEFIPDAVRRGADVMVTGDVKYHEYTDARSQILIADIGHYQSELCARTILERVLRKALPELTVYISETEHSPISII